MRESIQDEGREYVGSTLQHEANKGQPGYTTRCRLLRPTACLRWGLNG
jgi:hypothetical protein